MATESLTGVVGFDTRQADKAMRALNVIVKRFGRESAKAGSRGNQAMKLQAKLVAQAQRAVKSLTAERKRDANAAKRAIDATERRAKRAADAEQRRARRLGRARRRQRKARVRREKAAIAEISRAEARAAAKRRALFAVAGRLAVAGGIVGTIFLAGRVVADSLRSFRDFERGMAEVSTILDITDERLQGLGKTLQSFALQQGATQADTIRGFYQVVSAGITDAAGALDVLKASSDLAIAGLASQEAAVDIVTTALNAYQFAARDAVFVSDVLFTTVRLGKTRLEQLATTMGRVISIAASAGIRFEELNAAVAVLTRVQPTEIAVTGLRGVIAGIIKPSQKAAKQFKAMAIETDAYTIAARGMESVLADIAKKTRGSAFELGKLFENIRALSAITVLAAGDSEGFRKALEEIEEATGAVNDATEKMMNTTDFALKRLGSRWERFKTTVGSAAGSIVKFLEGINEETVKGARAADRFAGAFRRFFERRIEESQGDPIGRPRGTVAARGAEEAFLTSPELAQAREFQAISDKTLGIFRKLAQTFRNAGDAGSKTLRKLAADQRIFIKDQERSAAFVKGLQEQSRTTLADVFKAARGQSLDKTLKQAAEITKLSDKRVKNMREVSESIAGNIALRTMVAIQFGDPELLATAVRDARELAAERLDLHFADTATAADILDGIQKALNTDLEKTSKTLRDLNAEGQAAAWKAFAASVKEAEAATSGLDIASNAAAAAIERQRDAFGSLKDGISILRRLTSEANATRDALSRMQRTVEGRRFERGIERAGRARGGRGRARRLRELQELSERRPRGREAQEGQRRFIREQRRRIEREERSAERSARRRQRRRLRGRLATLETAGRFGEAARLAEQRAELLGRGAERRIQGLEDKAIAALQAQDRIAKTAEQGQQQAVTALRANVAQLGVAAQTAIANMATAQQKVRDLFAAAIEDAKDLGFIAKDIPVTVDTSQAQKAIADLQAQVTKLIRDAANIGGPVGRSGGGRVPNLAHGGVVFAQRGLFTPRGTDTVPAMLTPGEMVINRAATARNRGLLDAINRGQDSPGGTTIETLNVNVTLAGANLSAQDVATETVAAFRAETVGTPGSFNPITRNKSG